MQKWFISFLTLAIALGTLPASVSASGLSALEDSINQAVEKQDVTTVNKLLTEKFALRDNFINAARNDDLSTIKTILSLGLNINVRDYNGDTALHAAVQSSSIDTINYLLAQGANLNPRNNQGSTPLMAAISNANWEIVKLLLNQPTINIKAKDNWGSTALSNILQNLSEESVAIMKILLEKGADANQRANNWSNDTLLVNLLSNCAYGCSGNISANTIEAIKLLLQYGANPNVKSSYGNDPIIFSVLNTNLEVFKLFLDKKVDINSKNAAGETLLINIFSRGISFNDNTDYAKLLLQKGANVNATSNDGSTALMIAVSNSDLKAVKLLLQFKADVNAEDNNGNNVLSKATSQKIIKLLKKAGAKEQKTEDSSVPTSPENSSSSNNTIKPLPIK